MGQYTTPYLQLVSVAAAQGAGDALTNMANFTSLPTSGTIMSISLIDKGFQSASTEVYLSQASFTATTINAAFSPSDADLLNMVGYFTLNTWFAFVDNSVCEIDNIGRPYYTPDGKIYLQLITRGTPTPASSSDYLISLGIVY